MLVDYLFKLGPGKYLRLPRPYFSKCSSIICLSWALEGAPGLIDGSPSAGMKSSVGTERIPKAPASSRS